ncbi:MAG TPA: FtsX-like permease family protein [Solirubrobacteraceae bacterium]|nr:FtsX-like permease family protein [Solirubrobacteraceae bacterium]
MTASGWRPVLRIARRTVLRSPARSLLIAILVALPVAGATFADVIASSFDATRLEAQRIVGSADGAVTLTGLDRLPGGYDPRWLSDSGQPSEGPRKQTTSELATLLPKGTRVVAVPRERALTLREGERIVRTEMLIGDVDEPLDQNVMRLDGGARAPRAGEVLVTRRLGERMGLVDGGGVRPGATITPAGGHTGYRVAGLAVDPVCLSCEQVVAAPAAAIVRATRSVRQPDGNTAGASDPTYLVDLPDGADADAVGRTLAAHGIALTTRDGLLHPTDSGSRLSLNADAIRTGALVAVIVALGLLEVVLLAGTAFAVGARRQVRELGLVAAGGGSPRDVRRIVLAQGLVLGAIGAVLGVAAGFAIAFAGRPLWESLADARVPGWSFGPYEIAGAALVGLLSGLAAALVPAIGAARMRPVNALAGRFRAGAGVRRRNGLAGAGLVLLGIAGGLLGAHRLAADFAAYDRAVLQVKLTGRFLTAPSSDGAVTLVIASAALAVVGLVLLAPNLIGWISRVGGRLPLSARLAVRDAERQRHRTGPATSAIVIAVTGSVVLAFLLAGRFHGDELRDVPALPRHTIAVTPGDTSTRAMATVAQRMAAELPGGRHLALDVPVIPVRAGARDAGGGPAVAQPLAVQPPPRTCPLPDGDPCLGLDYGSASLAIGAADDAVTRLVAGPGFDAPARAALAAGEVLVLDAALLDDRGRVRIGDDRVPAMLAGHLVRGQRAYGNLPAGLISAAAARAHGWRIGAGSVLVTYGDRASRDDVDAAVNMSDEAGTSAIYDDGPDRRRNVVLLILAGAAAIMTLIGVAISIALSAAEGRADMATLAAVGAPPQRRRALMASQALLVGGLGCVLGVALGTFVAYTARATTLSPTFVVPWANLAATGIGVPLLAALVAALCTRGRLALVRRAD